MREADILQSWGLTVFDTYTCVFQGDRAPRAIAGQLAALAGAIASGQKSYDAIVVIRGGGAVTDLAWLNDLDLARAIAMFEIPVLTGIGHERDNTSLDEVSHRRFDTPSKVINHIMSVVTGNAQAGMAHMTSVLKDAQRVILQQETSTDAFLNQCRAEADKVAQRAESSAVQLLQSIDQQSQRLLDVSLATVESYAREVLGLSPKSTLDRGYALVRDEDGKVLTTCEQASGRKVLTIQMKDGALSVKPAKAPKAARVADEQSA
jgi:exodeoxyribonuclease VII large subunit